MDSGSAEDQADDRAVISAVAYQPTPLRPPRWHGEATPSARCPVCVQVLTPEASVAETEKVSFRSGEMPEICKHEACYSAVASLFGT